MKSKIQKFYICLEQERFYDAHEALEEVWFPRRFERNSEVKLLKGFINAAVSLELHKRDKSIQSKKVWANYLKYRPLLYRLESPFLNDYHTLSRYIENLYYNKFTQKKRVSI